MSPFDLELATDQHLDGHWSKANKFLHDRWPATYALILTRSRLPPLIAYDEALREHGYLATMIPYVETWSPNPVPWAAIAEVVVICYGQFEAFEPDDRRLEDAEALVRTRWPSSVERVEREAAEAAIAALSDEDLRARIKRLEEELRKSR